MRTILAALFAALLTLAPAVRAAAEAPPPLKMAYVDIKRAVNESDAFTDAATELERHVTERQKTLDAKVQELNRMREEFEIQSTTMTEEAMRARATEIDTFERGVREFYAAGNDELAEVQQSLEEDILKQLNDIIVAIGKEQGYDYVFTARTLAFAREEYDITATVLKRFNAAYRAARAAAPAGGN
jgi:outer membrane protein